MNKRIGAITENPSLVCKRCVLDNNHTVTEWAWSIGYPDGYKFYTYNPNYGYSWSTSPIWP